MITLRWFMIGVLFSLCFGCAEYEALPRDYQPQQQPQAQASAAVSQRAKGTAGPNHEDRF
jgi:hypothetical protein